MGIMFESLRHGSEPALLELLEFTEHHISAAIPIPVAHTFLLEPVDDMRLGCGSKLY